MSNLQEVTALELASMCLREGFCTALRSNGASHNSFSRLELHFFRVGCSGTGQTNLGADAHVLPGGPGDGFRDVAVLERGRERDRGDRPLDLHLRDLLLLRVAPVAAVHVAAPLAPVRRRHNLKARRAGF